MIGTTMVQASLATVPTLRMVERVAGLRALEVGSHAADERTNAAAEADRLSAEWRIGSTWLPCYAPAGAAPSSDDGVYTRQGVPWWRSHLAVLAACFYGFMGARPWHARKTDGGADFAMHLVGTTTAILGARALYAAGAVACASALVPDLRPEDVDVFLFGVTLGMVDEFKVAVLARQQVLNAEARTALVVRKADQADLVDMAAVMRDQESPLNRGKRLAAGLGKLAMGERPPPPPTEITFSDITRTMGGMGRWVTL